MALSQHLRKWTSRTSRPFPKRMVILQRPIINKSLKGPLPIKSKRKLLMNWIKLGPSWGSLNNLRFSTRWLRNSRMLVRSKTIETNCCNSRTCHHCVRSWIQWRLSIRKPAEIPSTTSHRCLSKQWVQQQRWERTSERSMEAGSHHSLTWRKEARRWISCKRSLKSWSTLIDKEKLWLFAQTQWQLVLHQTMPEASSLQTMMLLPSFSHQVCIVCHKSVIDSLIVDLLTISTSTTTTSLAKLRHMATASARRSTGFERIKRWRKP